MDKLIQAILAFFTALSAALGGPVDARNVPDRPAIIAPTPEPTLTITQTPQATEIEIGGVVQSVADHMIVVSGITIYVNAQTEIKGQLHIGARIIVEGIKRANEIQAREIRVIENASSSQASSSSSHTSTSVSSSSRRSTTSSSSESSASSQSSTSSRSSSSTSSESSSRSSSSKSSESSTRPSSSSSASSESSSRSSSSESSHASSSSSKSSDDSKSSSSSSSKK